MTDTTDSLWYVGDGSVELRALPIAPQDGQTQLRALFSGISRGTERLVLQGRVPTSEHDRMRCPHQDGDFTFPVKYGYALVGLVESGPDAGKPAFVLHPHQSRISVPSTDVRLLPDGLPPRRAVLTANMETALTVIWDSGIAPGDAVTVIGGGVLGLLTAALAARIVGTDVTVADIDESRAAVAKILGVRFAHPDDAPLDQDVVIHTSGNPTGLARSLTLAGVEATVVEASWYGNRAVQLPLGEAFHVRRLKLISSQVGSIPAEKRARWTYGRRLAKAMDLLRDDAFDALITQEIAFQDAPSGVPAALADGSPGLMTALRYS